MLNNIFGNFDISKYKKLMKRPIVMDGRNCYALEQFEGSGITYGSIGRKTINSTEE